MFRSMLLVVSVFALLAIGSQATAEDWLRFRGPNGSGISTSDKPAPTEWSNEKNLRWKVDLPGPGLSCPIVVGNRVLVTCWSGYGLDQRNPGNQEDLRRHILCFDRATGKKLWSDTIEPYLPEDRFGGQFAENGYATHTPVSDGKRIYAFFGKSGAIAYSLDGKRLWEKSLGTGSGASGWGSSSSPIIYKDMVIFTATAEDRAIVALNQETGEEVWKSQADGYASTWGSPVLADNGESKDVVLSVPGEVWALNADTGKLRWYCEGVPARYICSSAVADKGIVYAIDSGPGGGGAVAIKVPGEIEEKGITGSHVLWSKNERARIGTPLVHEGKLYFISGKVINCADALTGERIYQERLSGGSAPAGGDNGGGRFGRGGGQDYSSPVAADGKLFYVTRGGEMYVVALGSEFKQLAVNRFEGDDGDFSASPAIADGEIYIRSTKFLYCIANPDG